MLLILVNLILLVTYRLCCRCDIVKITSEMYHMWNFCQITGETLLKLKAKARDTYIALLTGKPDHPRFTIISVIRQTYY